ncbi:MAG: endonuclease domain-containing protein [Pseudorhodoplanes sp.]
MPHRKVPDRVRAHARSLRSEMTDAEGRIWFRLRAHRFQGASFRRQIPIGPYIADFACLDARLIVEIDGGQHASTHLTRDTVRDAWLQAQQFTVLRFWNSDVLTNLDGVLELIAEALAQAVPPSLTLPHSRSRMFTTSVTSKSDRTRVNSSSIGGGDSPPLPDELQ